MAQAFSYDDAARRESLLDVITNIDPTETQLFTGLGQSRATNTLHEYPVDTLKTPAANTNVEGSDASFSTSRTNPTRSNNITQIVRIDFNVTDTERAINHAGFQDRYAYEMNKAMTEWKNDAEFALMRAAVASGNDSTARQMNGVKSLITTNATSQSGVSLSETMLNDYLQNAWNQGGNVDEIYVGAALKRRISGFTAGATKFESNDDRRLVNAVDVYESDFGVHKLFKHRYIFQSGTDVNAGDIVGIENDRWYVAFLREPTHTPLAKTGSATKGMIEGELTLEGRAQKSSFLGQRHS
jgi:hypothetical protein